MHCLVNHLYDKSPICWTNFPANWMALLVFLFLCIHGSSGIEFVSTTRQDFVVRVKEETQGKGVDVVLDCIGASYFQRNIDSLAFDGKLFIIGFQGGNLTEINIAHLLMKRLTVQAAGLRYRSTENKAVIVSEVEKNVWPGIIQGCGEGCDV